MPVVISPLGLGRARRTDPSPHVTINGTGFSPNPGQNQVLMSGSSATITAESATQISFDFPFPFSLNISTLRSIHVPIQVVNLDTGERSTDAYVWIPGDLEEAADERIDSAIPGPFEITGDVEAPDRFEARDMERLAAFVEALVLDVQAGNVLAHDGSKIAEPDGLKGSGAGQLLVADPAEPTKLKWGFSADAMLAFGGSISAPTIVANLVANGTGIESVTTGLGTDAWAIDDGTLDLITFRNRSGGGALLDRIRVIVNGVAQFDSGAGLGAANYSQAIAVAVLKGDRIQVEATRAGGSGIGLVGGIRLLVD